jgi:sec-independent protein translocase protein TatC
MNDGEQKLTVLGHLQELRRRLIWSAIAVGVGVIICFIFREWLFFILEYPAAGLGFYYFQMTEPMSTIMMVSFAGGVILAMPVIVYHGIMFVAPALTHREKNIVLLIIPWIFLMFLMGVCFGYFLLAPWTIWFLSNFGAGIADFYPSISNYINFMAKLLLTTGLVFEMPVVSTFLARIGILKPEWLSSKRSIAIVAAFIIAAVITPPDPITQIILAIPLILLYEMSIALAKFVYKRKKEASVEVVTQSM